MITPEYLNRLTRLCEEATEGPWFECDFRLMSSVPTIRDIYVSCWWPDFIGVASMENGLTGTPDEALANAAFIAAAREAVPALVAALQAERARTAALVDSLDDMLAGWRYIRRCHGDLYGVGWDRCEESATRALAAAEGGGDD